jgi:ABC-type antimicrobial peptide transport system permease subunit
MATAQAIKRSREVGVRKVLGSSREQLFWQFMGETALITITAIVIGVFITEIALPYLNQMLNLNVSLTFDLVVVSYLLIIAIVVSFLSGSYPALIIAGYQPVLALKGKVSSSGSGSMSLRRGLVVAQFAISQALIIGTVIVVNQMELVAGRALSESDTVKEFLINESMARKIGFSNPEEAVGQVLLYGRAEKSVSVVGVVKDFNFLPLRERMEPVVMSTQATAYQEASIKIIPQNALQTIQAIQQVWQEVYPDYLFSHQFLDERLAEFYAEQQRMSNLFKVFSGIAIFIGCLGLYGLVSFMATQRTKEIGIRKVLGASSANIVMLFTKEYAKLLTTAFVIAAPLAWYVMQKWLDDFAFRIEIGADTFMTAGLVTLVIASATVGFKSVKTAVANPVNSLRSE